MLPIKISLPESFLDEEERCNYVVTSKTKKLWAVQIDLLEELKRVCQKYNLTYYVDSGTLLGTIRHKGYIPWDDDIDIVMKRDDYEKLLQLGQKEFSHPYFLQNAYNDDFIRGFSRLRNSETTFLTKNDIEVNCNKGIFIDIFPLDKLPENINESSLWLKYLKLKMDFIKVGKSFNQTRYKNPIKKMLCYLANKYFVFVNADHYFKRVTDECARFNNRDCKKISYISYSFGKKKHIWNTESYVEALEMPFEFTTVNVPVGYDSRLRIEYGDYMIMKKAPTAHGKALFDPEVPFDVFSKKHDYSEIKAYIEDYIDIPIV